MSLFKKIHMLWATISLLSVACCALSTTGSSMIPLFYKPLDSPIESDWGVVTYHEINNTAEFTPCQTLNRSHDGLACIGTHSLPHSECVGLVKDITCGSITVLLQRNSDSIRVFVSSSTKGFEITIMEDNSAPVPKFATTKPRHKSNTSPQKVPGIAADTIEDDGYEDEKEAELPPQKSWVKRNWMYIVPPLAILLVLLPEDKPTK